MELESKYFLVKSKGSNYHNRRGKGPKNGYDYNEEASIIAKPLGQEDFKAAESLKPTHDVKQHLLYGDLFEGDIIISDAEKEKLLGSGRQPIPKNALTDRSKRWPGGKVPYVITTQFNSTDRAVIAKAFMDFHEHTCIRFEPRKDEKDYIEIYKKTGHCESHVGRQGGKQLVSIGCTVPVQKGLANHELMHAIGFAHEHTRHDRDEYITILYENIVANSADFRKNRPREYDLLGAPYDFCSTMHYFDISFVKVCVRHH